MHGVRGCKGARGLLPFCGMPAELCLFAFSWRKAPLAYRLPVQDVWSALLVGLLCALRWSGCCWLLSPVSSGRFMQARTRTSPASLFATGARQVCSLPAGSVGCTRFCLPCSRRSSTGGDGRHRLHRLRARLLLSGQQHRVHAVPSGPSPGQQRPGEAQLRVYASARSLMKNCPRLALQSSCVACSPGFYAEESGRSACAPCAAGYFSTAENATTCQACPRGTFQSQPGRNSCEPCKALCLLAASGFAEMP